MQRVFRHLHDDVGLYVIYVFKESSSRTLSTIRFRKIRVLL